jgi:Family of unknown function (DUF6361)
VPSSLTWLAHDEAERRRMQEAVELFREQGTVDDLGIGSVRDAFSNLLFPGTKRSFRPVPGTSSSFPGSTVDSSEPVRDQVISRHESRWVRLIDALLAGGERRGVIGERARAELEMLPRRLPTALSEPGHTIGPMAVRVLSDHVRETVEREREVIAARLSSLREQSQRIHEVAETIDNDLEDAARLLRTMDEMLGRAPQLALESMHEELRGKKLQEIAVELLRRRHGAGATVHYREWFRLLQEAGVRIGGKDPLATFLTQIARAPAVESVRPRSGLYRLRSA